MNFIYSSKKNEQYQSITQTYNHSTKIYNKTIIKTKT